MARSIGLIPDKVIRYTCLTECATLLNVNEQIILDEIKKHLLQRDDNYLEQIKKEKDASATTGSLPPADTPFPAGSIPPADMPPLGVDDNVPPPFPPAEAEAGYQSYIPQEGREKYVFYVKEQLLLQTLIRHGEKVMCYVETEENTETPLTVIEYISMDLNRMNYSSIIRCTGKYWQKQKLICMTPTSRQSVIFWLIPILQSANWRQI